LRGIVVCEVSASERNSLIIAQDGSIGLPISLSCVKPQSVKSDRCRKWKPNFERFDPVKFRGQIREMSESILGTWHTVKPLVHFWLCISRPSGRWERGCQKRQRQNI